MGSLIAQEIALNHPEKIRKLILYASTCSVRKDDDANDATVQDKKIVNIFFTFRNQVMLKNMSVDEINKKNITFVFLRRLD